MYLSVLAPQITNELLEDQSLKVSGIQNLQQQISQSNITLLTPRDLNPRPLESQGYYVRPRANKHNKNQTPLIYLAQAACCLTN